MTQTRGHVIAATTIFALMGGAYFLGGTTKDITTLQGEYLAKEGKYLQILPDGSLPEYETGTAKQKLGQDAPAGTRVDIYEAPKGKGYQVLTEDTDNYYSVGYGPEAAERTWTREKAKPGPASSTPK